MARRGVSQRALAHHLGMAQQSLSRRLTGEYRLSVEELQGIAEALGVPAAELLGAA